MELRRRGFQVHTGENDDKDIGFMALRDKEKYYMQIAWSIMDEVF